MVSLSVPEDERATSPIVGVVLLLSLTVVIGAVVGTGVLLNKETVNADVQIAVSGDEVTVLWAGEGTATHIEVSTSNSLGNATIDAVNGTVTVPDDVGQPSANTEIIVRAVNNDSSRVIEERVVDLS